MKRFLALSLALCLSLSACSSGPKKISSPVNGSSFHDYTVDGLVDTFTDKGFSNVSTVENATEDPDKDGRIIKVSIDGKYSFSDVSQFLPDAPVVITYYTYTPPAPTPTPEPTPEPVDAEQIRTLANQADFNVLAYTAAGEDAYKNFVSLMSGGSASELELYNAANAMKGEVEGWYMEVYSLSLDEVPEFASYQDAARTYLYTMMRVSDAVCDYLDDNSASNLSDVQFATKSVNTYFDYIAPERIAFLLAVGYTEDEISTLHAQ